MDLARVPAGGYGAGIDATARHSTEERTMRRPHMSTGAWIFASVVTAAVVAPTAVYAAVNSRVAIGNTSNEVTASVTDHHQLLSTTIAPKDVVRANAESTGKGCTAVYTPPAGKGMVVSAVTYELLNDGPATGFLTDAVCTANAEPYDYADATGLQATQHTFPLGLPMRSVGLWNRASDRIEVVIYFYLIPASDLPGK
jgi:hypothetical protein